jgi:hypothetical protein
MTYYYTTTFTILHTPLLKSGRPAQTMSKSAIHQDPVVGSLVSRDASLPMTLPNTLNLSRATRNPFLAWELDRAWEPECLDARSI